MTTHPRASHRDGTRSPRGSALLLPRVMKTPLNRSATDCSSGIMSGRTGSSLGVREGRVRQEGLSLAYALAPPR